MSSSIGHTFLIQVRILREALLVHMVPAIPDAVDEAIHVEQSLRKFMEWRHGESRVDDHGAFDYPTGQAIDRYIELTSVRQGAINMGAVMLWHLLEQQMIFFLREELLSDTEVKCILSNSNCRDRLLRRSEFMKRVKVLGFNVEALPTWPKLKELSLVANSVKHAAGNSADRLYKKRPDLFTVPEGLSSLSSMNSDPSQPAQTAAGEDFCLTVQALEEYFVAVQNFWVDFRTAIERSPLPQARATSPTNSDSGTSSASQ